MLRLINKRGFSLVELVVTITILAILAGTMAGVTVSLMQMVIYLPRETKARTIAQESMDVFIEGDYKAMGLRYANEILEATTTSIKYRVGYPADGDIRDVEIALNNSKMQRRYTALGQAGQALPTTWETVPYYCTSEMSVSSVVTSGAIFTYYKSDGTVLDDPSANLDQICRVNIDILVTTGTGLFSNWEASFRARSGTEIRQYE